MFIIFILKINVLILFFTLTYAVTPLISNLSRIGCTRCFLVHNEKYVISDNALYERNMNIYGQNNLIEIDFSHYYNSRIITIGRGVTLYIKGVNFIANSYPLREELNFFLLINDSSEIILENCNITSIKSSFFTFFSSGTQTNTKITIKNLILKSSYFQTFINSNYINCNFNNLLILNNIILKDFIYLNSGNIIIDSMKLLNNTMKESFFEYDSSEKDRLILLMTNTLMYSNEINSYFFNMSINFYNIMRFINLKIMKNKFRSSFFCFLTKYYDLNLIIDNSFFIQNYHNNSSIIEVNHRTTALIYHTIRLNNTIIKSNTFINNYINYGIFLLYCFNKFELINSAIYMNLCIDQGCGLYSSLENILQIREDESVYLIQNSTFTSNEVIIIPVPIYIYFQLENKGYNCIYIDTLGVIVFLNSSFRFNIVQNQGNPCFLGSNRIAKVFLITDGFYAQNQATKYSSCFKIKAKEILIRNVYFINNVVDHKFELSTGVFDILCDKLILKNLVFYGNIGGIGSIIYIKTAIKNLVIEAESCIFIQNFGNNAIFYLFPIHLKPNFKFKLCSFIQNFNRFKGIIHLTTNIPNDVNLFFFSCIFYENYGTGVSIITISATSALIYFIDCFFINNKALSTNINSGILEAGIFSCLGETDSSFLILSWSIVFNNYGFNNFLFTNDLCHLIIEFTIIKNNFGVKNGLGTTNIYGVTEMEFCMIMNNNVSKEFLYEGGERSKTFIKKIIFKNNTCSTKGLIKLIQLASFSMVRTLFINNVGVHSAIIYSFNIYNIFEIINCVFINNIVQSNHFSLKYSSGLFKNITFKGNEGKLFSIILTYTNFTNITIKNHYSANKYTIPLFEILLNSFICFTNLLIYNLSTNTMYSCFEIRSSKINISHFKIIQFNIKKSTYFFEIYNSNFALINSKIENLQQKIFYFLETNVYINKFYYSSKSIKNKTSLSSIIVFIICDSIEINQSIFQNFFNENWEEIGIIDFYESVVKITNCIFSDNKAKYGGSIYIENSNTTIQNTIFLRNKAFFGGSIFFNCVNKICIWELLNNTFQNCEALMAGGAYYWITFEPLYDKNNFFIENRAISGNNFATPPLKLKLLIGNDKEKSDFNYQVSKYLPGNIFPVNLKFKLADFYDQNIDYFLTGKSFVEIFKINDLFNNMVYDTDGFIKGDIVSTFQNNTFLFNFENIIINSKDGSGILLNFQSDLIRIKNKNLINYTFPNYYEEIKGYHYLLYLNFQYCPLGYIKDLIKNTCIMCQKGKYSLSANDSSCHDCPMNANCSENGSFINVYPGYWRLNYFSTKIYKCKNVESCLGGDKCRFGYEGPLCDTCLINSKNQFYKGNDLQCYSCEDATLSYIFLGLISGFVLAYIVYSIKKTIQNVENLKNSSIRKNINYFNTEILIKILADYFNNFSCILSLLLNIDIDFNKYMNFFFNLFTFYRMTYPFDCFLYRFDFIKSSIYFKRIILGSILYFLMPLLFYLYWMIKGIFFRLNRPQKRKKIIITICVTCYIFQPTILNTYFNYQNCIIIDEKSYIKQQLNESCWENDHLFYYLAFVLPLLLLWMFILPGLLFLLMIRNQEKRRLSKSRYDYKYNVFRFFKIGYNKQNFYWDFVLLIRKYCLIFLSIFPISEKMIINSTIITIIVFLFIILQLFISPYKSLQLNKIALIYNYTLYITSICVLSMLNKVKLSLVIINIIFICFCNIVFIIFLGYIFFVGQKNVLIELLDKVKMNFGKMRRIMKIGQRIKVSI